MFGFGKSYTPRHTRSSPKHAVGRGRTQKKYGGRGKPHAPARARFSGGAFGGGLFGPATKGFIGWRFK